MREGLSLIEFGWFSTHAKFQLPWKIDCDALSDDDIDAIVKIIRWKFSFGDVYGVPRGGLRLAAALRPFCLEGYPLLIVDDVLTTGNSMKQARRDQNLAGENAIGIVIFARGQCPSWVWSIFAVNEWAQSRATGLG